MTGRRVYVFALRREARSSAPADWQQQVCRLAGVQYGDSLTLGRLQLEADSRSIERIRSELGEFVTIEPVAFRGVLPEER